MKAAIVALFSLACPLLALAATPPASQPERPKVEVVFVLDTTGSMSGLIAGAQAKIWQIANQIISGQPRPTVRMGLVPYRDKGDEYVTKVFDLTDDIDKVYTDLMGFKAQGGGDEPENVNQALADAVGKINWSADKKTLKIIFLVGDSPPHNEYTDVPTYDKLAKAAVEKGIYVNTVQCGERENTRKVWQEIALLAEGRYVGIRQDGGVRQVATPFDAELNKLNVALAATVVAHGTAEEQAKMKGYAVASTRPEAPAGAMVDRLEYAAKSGKSAGKGDLVDAVREGKKDVAAMAPAELPAEMKPMNAKEREEYVAKQQAERDKLNKQILDLSAKRADFQKQELAKQKNAGDGFDQQVIGTLQKQAERFNIQYASPTTQPAGK